MAYGFKRGMGRTMAEDAVCRASLFGGFFSPTCWSALVPDVIAPPPAPTGAALTTPPASGADAAALAQTLSDQQMAAQQAIASGQVSSSWWDQVTGGTSQVVDAVNPFNNPTGGVSWLVWAAGGVAVAALVFMGGGSPRRYGR